MSMNVGSSSGVRSDINITPLVDVVLVLLIIFMIVIPLTQVGYEVNTPPKVTGATPPPTTSDQLIVRVDADGHVFINKEQVAEQDLAGRFRDVLKNREQKIVFFAADGEVLYDKAAEVVDILHDAGAKNIGIVFEDLKPSAGVGQALGVTNP